MMRSLFSGVSGLKNHQTRMDVIGNNISNVNTTGFKSSRVNFEDSLSQTLTAASQGGDNVGGTNPKQIGLGSKISSIDVNFKDGSVQTTGINTDLCLSGNALFVVKQGNQTFYTRNGAFSFDADGNLVNAEGLYVQGYTNASATEHNSINTNGATSSIAVRAGKTMPSSATDVVNYVNNLNSSAAGITSISYTRKDGSTASVNTKGQEVNLTPEYKDIATITLTLEDGQTVIKDPALSKDYKTGETLGENTEYPVQGVTPQTATGVELTMEPNDNVTYSSTVKTNGTVGTSYAIGDTYTYNLVIKQAIANESDPDGPVTLIFEDGSPITQIKTPLPKEGKYEAGDTFTYKATIKQMDAAAGTKVTLDGYTKDSGIVDLTSAKTFTENKYTIDNSAVKIQSIQRSVTRGSAESDIVSAVLTMSDGTTQTVTSGKYVVGNSIPLSTTVKVYDSLGAAHVVPITLEKSYLADNQWVAKLAKTSIIEEDGTETTLSMKDTIVPFTDSGSYASTGSPGILNLSYGNGAADQQVTINYSNLTQYANSSTANAEGNGYASGTLESVTIDESGTVVGTYTNGVLRKEAQIAVAQFTNAPGLTKKGNSLYIESNNSGTPNIGTADSFGATITASALEMSNVDVAEEFSNMIITQRGFQSNSKIITVSDEMLENLINMKR